MDVPEPGATADPWGARAGAAAGAAAASEDPWQPYGIHTQTVHTLAQWKQSYLIMSTH